MAESGTTGRIGSKASMESFAHLRLHTSYSMRDGLLRLAPGPAPGPNQEPLRWLAPAAAERGIDAMAITDENNLFGAIKFYRSCESHGIKPIVGCDLNVGPSAAHESGPSMLFLCKDDFGYASLCWLITRAYERAAAGEDPWIDPEDLGASMCDGLIVLSGWSGGRIGRLLAADAERARKEAERWLALLGDRFYLEIQRVGLPNRERRQESLVEAHLELGVDLGLPVVCTHPVQFIDPEDYEAHEARVCILEGTELDCQERRRRFHETQYLKSAQEMHELFADIPDAVRNAGEIARRCNFRFGFGKYKLPSLIRKGKGSVPEALGARVRDELNAVLAKKSPSAQETYHARLQEELEVIFRMGFSDYFLIVADIVDWAKEQGIPVGPGRGSGAGSLVAYALGVTMVDPIEHGLLFERFLNPERVSMPDLDIDFCQDSRDRVIQHVRERFGPDCVSQICTFGTLGAKAVVHDVGRTLGLSPGHRDRIAGMIPVAVDMTLATAREENKEIPGEIRADSQCARLFELARQLEGLPRNVSTHASAVLIAPDRLVNYCPMFAARRSSAFACQFDKDDVEALGLVKFDFLGLTELTKIAEVLRIAGELDPAVRGLRPEDIPLDDPEVYRLLAEADTAGVFQLESGGMRRLMVRLKPDSFDKIVALLALFRPGPLESGMAEQFIRRCHGEEPADLIDESLQDVLADTYGVVVYQEQVMRMFRILADYSLGEADLLRRAMGKKKPEEMAKHKARFVSQAAPRLKRGKKEAADLFERIEKFAGYGFNKSHAVAYAMIAVQTAWLKCKHPAAFFAAAMSANMSDAKHMRRMMSSAVARGVSIHPPDVNRSGVRFTAENVRTVRFGLCGIKGFGLGAGEELVAERAKNGDFKTGDDFINRVAELGLFSRAMLEQLAFAGALDPLNANRAQMREFIRLSVGDGISSAAPGQELLFDDSEMKALMPEVPEWGMERRLQEEFDAIGFALSGSMYEAYAPWITKNCRAARIEEVAPAAGTQRIAGVVVERIKSRRMARQGIEALIIEDSSGSIEVTVDRSLLRKETELCKTGSLAIVEGTRRQYKSPGEFGFRAERIWSREGWVADRMRRMKVTCRLGNGSLDAALEKLCRLIRENGGGSCRILLRCNGPDFSCDIDLGQGNAVPAGMESVRRIEAVFGKGSVSLDCS